MSTLDDNDPYTARFGARCRVAPRGIDGAAGELGVGALCRQYSDTSLLCFDDPQSGARSHTLHQGDEVVGRIGMSALKLLALKLLTLRILRVSVKSSSGVTNWSLSCACLSLLRRLISRSRLFRVRGFLSYLISQKPIPLRVNTVIVVETSNETVFVEVALNDESYLPAIRR
jgi:hypothetical protein